MHTLNMKTADFYKRAVGVAEHYGFRHVEDIATPKRTRGQNTFGLAQHKVEEAMMPEHSFSSCFSHQAVQDATARKESLLFYTPSIVSHRSGQNGKVSAFTLNMVGSRQPLSEVLVLKTALGILSELGIADILVRVNSIGDRDSSTRYLREVGAVLRKKLSELPDHYQELARGDLSRALLALMEDRHEILAQLPRPVEFLTSPSRKHFKELLEYLDATDVPFVLDDHLYASRSMYAHTLFEVIDPATHGEPGRTMPYARGGRYDELTRSFSRHAVPAVGIVLAFQTKDAARDVPRPRAQRPKACLIQVGHEAQLLSFSVVESFRRARIPIEQCIQFDKFSEQLAYAESRQAPYVIIIGHKEAIDRSVIVRNRLNRSQQTVPVDVLPQFFRNVPQAVA